MIANTDLAKATRGWGSNLIKKKSKRRGRRTAMPLVSKKRLPVPMAQAMA